MANVRKADLFVSIHCNAHKSTRLNGLETYYLDLAKSEDAVRVAARENAVSAKHISDLQYILTDLMLNSKINESKDLATNVHKSLIQAIRSKYKMRDHGVRSAPFYVLMGAKMPSILVELGYITNQEEARRMKTDAYLRRKAAGLVKGIVAYKQQIERFASL
jgi:N-acetylmuramoyl-L-alanine amidase